MHSWKRPCDNRDSSSPGEKRTTEGIEKIEQKVSCDLESLGKTLTEKIAERKVA